jgi:PKD repeat protein
MGPGAVAHSPSYPPGPVEEPVKSPQSVTLSGVEAAETPVDMVVESATANPNDTARVALRVDSGQVAGYRATIAFDTDVIRVRSVAGDDFPKPITNVDNQAGTAILTQSRATAQSTPTLAVLTIEFVGEPGAISPLELVPSNTSANTEMRQAEVRVNNGSATVMGHTPVADAGLDRTITGSAPVNLSGSDSRDPDGGPLQYNWTQTAGPTATILDSGSATPTVRLPTVATPRTLTFALTVTDDRGASDIDTVNLTIDPNRPVDSPRFRVGNATVTPTGLTTVNLSVEGAAVAGYRATLRFDPTVVQVRSVTGVEFADPIVNVDNETGQVVVTQSLATERDSPTVAAVTLAVVGDPGTLSRLSFLPSETSLNNATTTLHTVTRNGTVRVRADAVSPGPPIGNSSVPPGDLDNDGRYEDVNGNGREEYADVVLLFQRLGSSAVREGASRFDFNENGRLDFADVVELFESM